MSNDSPATVCKILKLKTGEVIISNVKVFSKSYSLNRPMNLITIPLMDKQGNIKSSNLILKNWIEYSQEEEFTIPKNQVILIAEPQKEVIEYYEETKIDDDIGKAEDEMELEKKIKSETKLSNKEKNNIEKDLKNYLPDGIIKPSTEDSSDDKPRHNNRFKGMFD